METLPAKEISIFFIAKTQKPSDQHLNFSRFCAFAVIIDFTTTSFLFPVFAYIFVFRTSLIRTFMECGY